MKPFTFSRAATQQEAINMKRSSNAKFIGGGTNLIDLMKLDIETPEKIIDINSLGLNQVEEVRGGVLIGTLVRNSELAYHPIIKSQFPVLSQAILAGASPQLRNMATTGGNLMQRTRCPYFYDTAYACNKRAPGTGCAAMKGYNRSHAILGGSEHCIATHPSDMCVALAMLDAVIMVKGPDGERNIAFTEFHLLPGHTPHLETALQPGELITAVYIPRLQFARNSTYLKVRDRASYEFALASAAVALDIQGGVIRDARIAMGGIGAKPWRIKRAEALLKGMNAGRHAYAEAAEEGLRNAHTHKHNAFKVELAKRTLIQALEQAGGTA